MDNRMLALWATPRSCASEFERMMRARGDHRTLYEPFAGAYHRGADRRTTRFDAGPQDMTITYASTWADVQREHRKGPVFVADMANYVIHLAQPEFLDRFQHTFLIRDPAEALPLVHDDWSTFTMDECAYQPQRLLFDLVTDRFGRPPIVIDTSDFALDTQRTVEAYCKAADIPFMAESLPRVTRDVPTGTVNDSPFLRDMYDRCRPHYEALAEHRL